MHPRYVNSQIIRRRTICEAVKRESNSSLLINTAAVSQWPNHNRVVLSTKKTKESACI